MEYCVAIDPQNFFPHARPDDPRLAESVRSLQGTAQLSARDVVIIGVPDDRGIAVNGGRPGAALGPAAFRQAFYRMPGTWDLWDAGDVMPGDNNVETHERLARVVAAIVTAGALPIVIGGSHDTTYGGITGLARAGVVPAVMNWDAHLDVRPATADADGNVNSGCAFRRLLEADIIHGDQLWEIGYAVQSASAVHLAWARDQGVHCWAWSTLYSPDLCTMTQQLCAGAATTGDGLAISFDLDLISGNVAPGVSAPAVLGLSAQEAVTCFQLFAQQPMLRYLDLMELSPPHDVGGQTARLVATLVWMFCRVRLEGPWRNV